MFILLGLAILFFVLSFFMGIKTNKFDDELGFSFFVLNLVFILLLFGVFIGTVVSGNWNIGLYLLVVVVFYSTGYLLGVSHESR
jgi:hypothetical protein